MRVTNNVIILGAGAAGLMCAIEAGKRGRSVLILERNKNIGEKIRISGGGRCNFTNVDAGFEHYHSNNPHFSKSALAQFTPSHLIALVEKHGIPYHEKKLGQLFCDTSSKEILAMLKKESQTSNVEILTECEIKSLSKESEFIVQTNKGTFISESLVVATGGISIPKLGASDLGYRIARQFGLNVHPPKPGLVPFVCNKQDVEFCNKLSGISLDAIVSCNKKTFRENILFTHRGLSGPAILQISSFWNDGDTVTINCLPEIELYDYLKEQHQTKKEMITILSEILPKRFVQLWCERTIQSKIMNQYSNKELSTIAQQLHQWKVIPTGTEGFGKAEVTCGGIDTNELSSKTMESKKIPGLYCIGEVVDVTGELGGYNFQWAWASGFAAGKRV